MAVKTSATIDVTALRAAGASATGYITDITNNGIKVASATASNLNYVTIDATGMEIFKSNGASTASAVSVAKFGEITRIGEESGSHLLLDYHSLKLEVPSNRGMEHSDNTYFRVLDLRDNTGKYTITDEKLVYWIDRMASNAWHFKFPVNTSYPITVKKNGTTVSSSGYTFHSSDTADYITFTSDPSDTDTITASYTTTSPYAITLMFGWRDEEHAEIGPSSIALGPHVEASGKFSVSIGMESKASGIDAIAMGNGLAGGNHSFAVISGLTKGECSVAIGRQAHAYGEDSYAIGRNTYANNDVNYLFGDHLESNATGQVILGSYNSPSVDDFLEIGLDSPNGTSRQNALAIDWDGNLKSYGTITASGHSSPIGTISSTVSGTKSIPHNSWTNMDNVGLTLDPGTWIIIGTAAFPNKTSGRIGVRIRNYTASANNDVARTLVPYSVESAISCVALTSIDISSVFYLQVYQSCGSQVTTGTCYMKAVRIC